MKYEPAKYESAILHIDSHPGIKPAGSGWIISVSCYKTNDSEPESGGYDSEEVQGDPYEDAENLADLILDVAEYVSIMDTDGNEWKCVQRTA